MTGTIIAAVILLAVTALLILSKPRWKSRWKYRVEDEQFNGRKDQGNH